MLASSLGWRPTADLIWGIRMTYFVKLCGKCKAANHPSMTFCGKCGADLPDQKIESDTKPIQPPAYAVQTQQETHNHATGMSGEVLPSKPAEVIACKVVDIEMPFLSMVTLLVKCALASIPALIIVTIYVFFALAILAAIGSGLGRG